MSIKSKRIFIFSLLLSILSNVYRGLTPYTSLYLHQIGIRNIEIYGDLIKLIGYGITLLIVRTGYRLGKTTNIENEYMDYVKALGAGWIASLLLLTPSLLSSDETWRQVAQSTLLQSTMSGHLTGVKLFSGLVLGWLVDNEFKITRTWYLEIRKPVLVYNGVVLVSTLIRNVLFTVFLGEIGNTNIRSYGVYSTILSLLTYPVWIWYLSQMLSSGRNVDLREDYGSILYTIWVPSVVVMSLIYFSNALITQNVNGLMDLLDFMLTYVLKLVESSLGVFGVAFSLLCFGYVHSRYRYSTQLNRSEEDP